MERLMEVAPVVIALPDDVHRTAFSNASRSRIGRPNSRALAALELVESGSVRHIVWIVANFRIYPIAFFVALDAFKGRNPPCLIPESLIAVIRCIVRRVEPTYKS